MHQSVIPSSRRVIGVLALLVGGLITVQASAALAAPTTTVGAREQVAQGVATPTPFRFLTPTPIVPRTTTTTGVTTTTTTGTTPNAGGFPMELALPALAGGLVAIGGGSFLLRRKPAR